MSVTKPTPAQVKYILGLCQHNEDVKEQAVLSISNGRTTHITDLRYHEACNLIERLKGQKKSHKTPRYLQFDLGRSQHRKILSTLKQLGWTAPNEKYGKVANMQQFYNWCMSDKSPVKKCLMDMLPQELSKVIHALEQMLIKG